MKEFSIRKVVAHFLDSGGITSDTIPYDDHKNQYLYRYGYRIGIQLIENGVTSYKHARIYSYNDKENEVFNEGMKSAFKFRRK